MEHAERMQALLAPLQIYRWEGSFQWAELLSEGASLDDCQTDLLTLEREMNLQTAEAYGLAEIKRLLAHPPHAADAEALRRALAALLRIQDGSFTVQAINDNLDGCGLVARAVELEAGRRIGVVFPQVAGIPQDFAEVAPIIEDILPCHLEIEYLFWFILWRELEERLPSWRAIEDLRLSWERLQAYVV